jgi:hypothetical protein
MLPNSGGVKYKNGYFYSITFLSIILSVPADAFLFCNYYPIINEDSQRSLLSRGNIMCVVGALRERSIPIIAVAPEFAIYFLTAEIREQKRTYSFSGIASPSLLLRAYPYFIEPLKG